MSGQFESRYQTKKYEQCVARYYMKNGSFVGELYASGICYKSEPGFFRHTYLVKKRMKLLKLLGVV